MANTQHSVLGEKVKTGYKHLGVPLHNKILIMANTGIRPFESNWLEYGGIEIVNDDTTGETIRETEMRGEHGVGYSKSTTGTAFFTLYFAQKENDNGKEPYSRIQARGGAGCADQWVNHCPLGYA